MGSKQKTSFYFQLSSKSDNVIDALSEAKRFLDNDSEVVSISVYKHDTDDELIATILQNGVVAFNSKYKG